MTLRADSYSSVADVQALTAHLLDGQAAYNSTTRPTVTQVEGLIDQISAQLNVALAGAGLTVPVTNTTAKAACDGWVRFKAAAAVEETAQGLSTWGMLDAERPGTMMTISGAAGKFAKANALGFKRLGVAVGHVSSEGLTFTGQTATADRADRTDTGLRPPRFERGMFGDEVTVNTT